MVTTPLDSSSSTLVYLVTHASHRTFWTCKTAQISTTKMVVHKAWHNFSWLSPFCLILFKMSYYADFSYLVYSKGHTCREFSLACQDNFLSSKDNVHMAWHHHVHISLSILWLKCARHFLNDSFLFIYITYIKWKQYSVIL